MSIIWQADAAGVARAAGRLAAGGVVALPTETVYGLAADASDGRAVARVFAAKGRPSFNPLIVHVRDAEEAATLAVLDACAGRLIEQFWPGPLTLVLPLAERAPVAPLALSGMTTVAIRSPSHPVAREVLWSLGRPVVAPSANRSGHVSPTTAAHVASDLPEVPVLDGGPCEVGLESTIISLAGSRPLLLRPGTVTREAIEAVLGHPVAGITEEEAKGGLLAPGMMASHYAPNAAVRLNADDKREGEVLLGFGGTPGATKDLSPTADLTEAAAALFGALRELDGLAPTIAVAPIPDTGLGLAINDRLRRAAAPRSSG